MLQRNVIVAYGTVNIDQALARAEERGARRRLPIVVGIVRNPSGKCWWVCLAWQCTDITWGSAHRLRRQAKAQVAVVERVVRGGYLDNAAACAELVQELAAHGDDELQHTLALARGMRMRSRQSGRSQTSSPPVRGTIGPRMGDAEGSHAAAPAYQARD